MNARELIERKKRNERLSRDEIAWLVRSYTDGSVPDYLMAAFLMAVWFRQLDTAETLALTDAMMRSGRVLDLSDIPGPKIDKHSTGGIGDKVSLPLIGIAMACGLRVPMLSGRGLGHTGGTLDKLEAIPGYSTLFDEARYRDALRTLGGTIVGQSQDLAPADGRLYELRDVTATVDCVPLIVASILSKKFAAGVEGVVLDVKAGSGAFMRDLAAARALGTQLMAVADAFGRRVSVVLTRMDEPLGEAVGNAIEVVESVDLLRGGGPADLRLVTLALAGEMLLLGGLEREPSVAEDRAQEQIRNGRALACFRALVEHHGGRLDWEAPDCGLRVAPRAAEVCAPRAGYLGAVNGYDVGMAVVELGGGRQKLGDTIDASVGLRWKVRIGEQVAAGQPFVEVLARRGHDVAEVSARLQRAVSWSDAPVAVPPRVLERLPPPARGDSRT